MQHRSNVNRERKDAGRIARLGRPARLATLATALALIIAGTAAAAFVNLPADGSQVDNDPAAGIDPSRDAGLSDVQGGSVVAGNLQVPWAAFEHGRAAGQQIFVRAFKAGQWVTQGFPASLNVDPTVDAEAPSIDFAGAARTVPWVSWSSPTRTSATRSRSSRAASRPRRTSGCPPARSGRRATTCPRSTSTRTVTPRTRPSSAGRPSRATTRCLGRVAGARRSRCRGDEPDLRLARRQVVGGRALRRQAGERRHQPERLLLVAAGPRSARRDDRRLLDDG